MFYHLTPTSNKESILKNGLVGGCRQRSIFFARSVFDAFMLAPPSTEYFYAWKICKDLTNSLYACFLDWQQRPFKVSLFSVDDNEIMTVRERSNYSLKYICKLWRLEYNEEWENRTLIEYLSSDNIPPEKLKFVRDYELITWMGYKLDPAEEAIRKKELKELKNKGSSSEEALKIMNKKYVPKIEIYLPPNDGFKPIETDYELPQDLLGRAANVYEADILEAIESHSFDEIPDVKEMLQSEYGEELRRQYKDFHEDLIYKSVIHGSAHIERVMLLGAIIAHKERLSMEDTRLLLTACAYHDIGRVNDREDSMHGKRAAEMLRHLSDITSQVYDKATLCAIIAGHSCPDSSIEYFMNYYEVDQEERGRCRELFYCLKDADNLDRVRFTDLDVNYLRHGSSAGLAETAAKIVDIYMTSALWGVMHRLKCRISPA